MNSQQHLVIGFFIAAILYIYFAMNGKALDAIVVPIAVAVGSIFPDILDPAKSSTHRDKAHNKKMFEYSGAFALLFFGITIWIVTPFTVPILFFSLGYFFHLLIDSQTAAGLTGYPLGHIFGPKNPISDKQKSYIMDLDPSYRNHGFDGWSTMDAAKLIEELKTR